MWFATLRGSQTDTQNERKQLFLRQSHRKGKIKHTLP